jgi:hypothetical protein
MIQLPAIDPGFKSDGLTLFTTALPAARSPQPADVVGAYDRLTERLRAVPGVVSVARVSGLPLGNSENVQVFTRPDQAPPPPGTAPITLYRVVDPAYFATMGIPIVGGRPFAPTDVASEPPWSSSAARSRTGSGLAKTRLDSACSWARSDR